MAERTRVYSKKRSRGNIPLVYADPETGREVSKSSGSKVKQDAEREAAKLENDLNSGRHATGDAMQ